MGEAGRGLGDACATTARERGNEEEAERTGGDVMIQ